MLKSFLAKHFGLVELNQMEKTALKNFYIKAVSGSAPIDIKLRELRHEFSAERLTALGIPFTYNKRTGIK